MSTCESRSSISMTSISLDGPWGCNCGAPMPRAPERPGASATSAPSRTTGMWRGALMERTVGHLVMASRAGFGNGCQLGIGVDMTRTGAILQLTDVVGQALSSLLMRLGLERVGMAATATRTISRELPGGLVRVGGMAGSAAWHAFVLARVLGRGVCERHHRPVRIVVARGAVERGRHVVGDFAGRGAAVVTRLTVGRESRVVEASRAPRQGTVARSAVLGRRYVIAR